MSSQTVRRRSAFCGHTRGEYQMCWYTHEKPQRLASSLPAVFLRRTILNELPFCSMGWILGLREPWNAYTIKNANTRYGNPSILWFYRTRVYGMCRLDPACIIQYAIQVPVLEYSSTHECRHAAASLTSLQKSHQTPTATDSRMIQK